MTGKSRFSLTTVMVLMVFVLSAIWTVPAFADDSAPPPTETPVTETDPTPPAPDSVAEPTADSVPVEEPTSIAELLDQLPEGTTVIVTDSAGEPLPLVTDEAAQVIANSDPMWCPVGVTPGGAGCTTPGQTSFADMLTELSLQNSGAGPKKAGVIWIEDDYESSVGDFGETNFTLDGAILTEMAKYALTIQGGWTGSGKTTDPFNPSEFNASLNILDWLGAVTINDILIAGATVNPNTGTFGTSALIVQSNQSITLNRVQVMDSSNGMNGADLDNQASSSLASVVVNEGIFNHNSGSGLIIHSAGTITIRNLTANYNGTDDGNFDYGAFISNWTPGPDYNKPITLNGTNDFKGNLGTGLFVSSYGIVTLNNITATGNDDITDDDGIPSNGDEGDGLGVDIDASLSVKLTGTNLINYNQTNGLEISSDGTVSLNNVTASNNGDNGLNIDSFGSIVLNNVIANNNVGGGAVLDNCLKPAANTACMVIGKPVTLTGINVFNWNGFEGLVVQTDGVISISKVTALHNGSFGVYLDNCALDTIPVIDICTNTLPYAVSIKNSSSFLYNSDDGLYIRTTGAVSLKSITSSFNDNRGVFIDNRANPLKPQKVTLSGSNIINGNDNIGLRILSYGAVNISNLTANDNGIVDACQFCFGAWIDNANPNGGTLESFVVSRQPVTLTGTNNFNNNYSAGLYVYSVGAITLSNVTASGTVNNVGATVGDGVYLYNNWHWVPGGVTGGPRTSYVANITINGFGIFENNADEGLQIFTHGAVKLNNITANNNNGYGLYVDNRYYRSTPVPVGSILASRQPVTLTGINTFTSNLGGGLYVYSVGAIAVSNITAIDNRGTGSGGLGNGVYLHNDWDWYATGVTLKPYAANITLSGFGYFESNTQNGLQIISRGLVTLINLTANNNGDSGVNIFTVGDTLPQNVTLNGVNNFYGNGFTSGTGNGLFVQNDGKITISNLSAIGNKAIGASLDNFTFLKVGKFLGVTLTGFNAFQENQGTDGLYIHTDGSVVLSRVTADNNTGNGVQVLATKNITLTCGTAYSNTGTGFLLHSGGILTLKGLHSYYNGIDEDFLPINPIRTWACP